MADYDYDLYVIGGGSGGVRAARVSAQLGARVALAEERYLGGTCVNVGCVPKKLFVYASHFGEDFGDARGFGWNHAGGEFEWPQLRDNKDREISRLNGVYGKLLDNAGVTVHEGTARLVDGHTVEINGRKVTAANILLATGCWPWAPEFPGSEHVISSNEVFHLERFPERAVVVGGGYIAVEFAGIFAGLGVETHLVYRRDLFLRGFDDDVRRFAADECRKKHINLHFSNDITRIEKQGDTLVSHLKDGESLGTDLVMYATGRRAKIDGLGLEAAGVATRDDGAIVVDDDYRTSVASVYALGDVIGRIELTPVALAEGMALAHNLFGENGGEPRRVDYENIPTTVFCQPNLGTVGLTEAEARERHGELRIYRSEFRAMKHTLSGRDERTLMKMIVDHASDRVVGVHMAGAEAGEIIQGIAVAMRAGATKATFDSTIGIHPTAAEEFVTMREPVSGPGAS